MECKEQVPFRTTCHPKYSDMRCPHALARLVCRVRHIAARWSRMLEPRATPEKGDRRCEWVTKFWGKLMMWYGVQDFHAVWSRMLFGAARVPPHTVKQNDKRCRQVNKMTTD